MTEKKDKKKTIADLAGSIPNTPDIGEIRENQERDVVKHRYNFEKLEQQLEKLTVGRRKALWEVDKKAGRKPQIRRSWFYIREGMRLCREDPENLKACIEKAKKRGVVSEPWLRLLTNKEPDREREILDYTNFYDIPPGPGRDWWETQVKNHPFVAIRELIPEYV